MMVADEKRMAPYVAALEAAVTSESVVLDLGCGTGVFSILASKFGAKKVYAIEANPLIELAKVFAGEHGVSDRIEFYRKLSTVVELPEKADILICDIRDSTPLNGSSIDTIIDARNRLLKPGAVMIAESDVMYFALVRSERTYEFNISRYQKDFYGVNFSSAKRLLTNQMMFPESKDLTLISEPLKFAKIDYRSVEERSFKNQMNWIIDQDSIIHGIRSWFDSKIGFGETMTTSPENPEMVYGVQFLPFEEAIDAKAGDRIEVDLAANYVEGNYVWTWNTRHFDVDDNRLPTKKFYQSTDAGTFNAPSDIQKRSEYFLPELNENAEINKLYLNSVDGDMLLGDIADLLLEKFPERFKDFDEAFSHAGLLSQHYSK